MSELQKEIDRAAEKYANDVFLDNYKISVDNPWPEFRDTYKAAFLAGVQFALGLQGGTGEIL